MARDLLLEKGEVEVPAQAGELEDGEQQPEEESNREQAFVGGMKIFCPQV